MADRRLLPLLLFSSAEALCVAKAAGGLRFARPSAPLRSAHPIGVIDENDYLPGGSKGPPLVEEEVEKSSPVEFLGKAVTAPFKVLGVSAAFKTVMGPTDESDKALDLAFARVDADGSGSVTAEEMRAYINRIYGMDGGDTVCADTVDQMMKTADTDGSGCLDIVEFRKIMRGVASVTATKGSVPIGSLLDVDGDGEITADEVRGASFRAIALETDLYNEVSRALRKDDVFTYDRWKAHRSSGRIFRDLRTVWTSGVTRGGWKSIATAFGAAMAIFIWNDCLTTVGKFLATQAFPYAAVASSAILARPTLMCNLWPWTMTSGFLSLLIVFRTNTAFSRFNEARCLWGSIVNTCRDLSRQMTWLTGISAEKKRAGVARCCAFCHALLFHLGEQTKKDQEEVRLNIMRLLGEKEGGRVLACTHKPIATLGFLSQSISSSGLPDPQRAKLDAGVTTLCDAMGACERIFKTPMPRVYTRHTTRFLATWLFTLPLGIYSSATAKWTVPLAILVMSTFILGIEELANVLEEPFSMLPLNKIIAGIEAGVFENLEVAGNTALLSPVNGDLSTPSYAEADLSNALGVVAAR